MSIVFQHVVSAGDSFSSHPYDPEAFAFPDYVTVATRIDNYSIPGICLVADIAPAFSANLDRSPAADSAFIQGGLNDCARWDPARIPLRMQLWRMQSAVAGMAAEVASRGLNTLIVNVAAWQEFAPWSPERQVLTEHYNGWAAEFARRLQIPYVDIYSLLQDKAQPMRMHPDFGGPLHPHEQGAREIAGAIDACIRELRQRGLNSRPQPDALSDELARLKKAAPRPSLLSSLKRRLMGN